MSSNKSSEHFNENGIGATTANSSFGDSLPWNSTNSPTTSSRGINKIGWFIAGTIVFVLIIGLAVGLNKQSSDQASPAVDTAPTATTGDDGNVADISTTPTEPNTEEIISNKEIISNNDENEPAASDSYSKDDKPTDSYDKPTSDGTGASLFEQTLSGGDFALLHFDAKETSTSSTSTPTTTSSSPTKSPTVNALVSQEFDPDSISNATNTTSSPSRATSPSPSASPTKQTSNAPSAGPTKEPTTGSPSSSPSNNPSSEPTEVPTKKPVIQMDLSNWVSIFANTRPTASPSKAPSPAPSSKQPTLAVSDTPSPTNGPTHYPSSSPTQSPTTGKPTPTFSFYGKVGEDFFNDEKGVEASGVDIAPDRSHLIVVADGGDIIFLNLLDYNSGSCMLDLTDEANGKKDFEGVAIDPTIWKADDMHAYVVHEGGDDDEPLLHKIKYQYDPAAGSCSASVVDTKSLYGAIPCLTTGNGIESLGLKSASTATDPAVFFVGIQDTGNIYEITSEGLSNGPNCYGGMGKDDISASTYSFENGHIWSFIESENTIDVVDTAKDCIVATYDMSSPLDEEGLAIDFENGLMYLVVDGQGDGSVVSVYNFTYPTDMTECMPNIVSPGSCSGFSVCGDDRKYFRP